MPTAASSSHRFHCRPRGISAAGLPPPPRAAPVACDGADCTSAVPTTVQTVAASMPSIGPKTPKLSCAANVTTPGESHTTARQSTAARRGSASDYFTPRVPLTSRGKLTGDSTATTGWEGFNFDLDDLKTRKRRKRYKSSWETVRLMTAGHRYISKFTDQDRRAVRDVVWFLEENGKTFVDDDFKPAEAHPVHFPEGAKWARVCDILPGADLFGQHGNNIVDFDDPVQVGYQPSTPP